MRCRFHTRFFWTVSGSLLLISILGLLLPMSVTPIKAQTSTIYGFVTEPDGVTPVPNGDVELWPVGASVPIAWDTTLIDGSFAFATESLPPGQYRIIARYPSGEFGASLPYAFSLEDNVTDVKVGVVRLTYPQLEGVVVGPDGIAPSGAVEVNLVSADGTTSLWDSSTPTRNFRFSGLPPGSYILKVELPEGSPFWSPEPIPIALEDRDPYQPASVQFVTIRLAPPQIMGAVVNPDGVTRYERGDVNLRSADGTVSQWDTSGPDKNFMFGNLKPGSYTIQAMVPDDSPYWPPSPVVITVTEKAQVIGPDFVTITLSYPQVAGVVLEPEADKPVSTQNVNLYNADRSVSEWAATTITSPFRFGGLPAGDYFLQVSPAEEETLFWPTEPLAVTLKDPSEYRTGPQAVTLTLTYPQVVGIVVEPETDKRVSTQNVNLYNADHSISEWAATTITSPFRFGGLPAGAYFLEARLEGEETPFLSTEPLAVALRKPGEYRETGPQAVTLTLTYVQVVGLVVEPDGVTRTQVDGVNLRNADSTISRWDSTTVTKPFAFGGLPAGEYALEVSLEETSPYWATEPLSVMVREESKYRAEAVQFVTLTLYYPQVAGTVVEPDGATPASTGDVNMRTPDGVTSLWDTVAAGQFRFGGAEEGDYLLEALPPEDSAFMNSTALALTIAEGERYPKQPPSPVILTLNYPQVVGLVVEPDGVTRIGSVEANLKSADGTVEQWSTSTSTAPFRFGGLNPGDYVLRVSLPSGVPFWPPAPTSVSLEEGSQYQPPEVITLIAEYPNVTGRLIYQGQPVAGAYVGVYTWDGSVSNWTVSDDEGYFVIGGLSPDRYTLDVTVPLPEDAGYWIGPPVQMAFELENEHVLIDLGVIELVKWPSLIDSHLTH